MQAIIFDFNGTMFFDTDKHVKAWELYLENLCGRVITKEEYNKYVHGKTNAVILTHFMGRELEKSECDKMAEEKESLYRKLAKEDTKNFKLAEGLPAFLDILKEKNIPAAIATSSGISNMDFYFEHFGLARWFTMNQVVYDNGTFRGKPEADIYLKAAKTLHKDPRDCMVVEDSPAGIEAANRAGAGKIIAMAYGGNHDKLKVLNGVSAVIDNYVGFENLI